MNDDGVDPAVTASVGDASWTIEPAIPTPETVTVAGLPTVTTGEESASGIDAGHSAVVSATGTTTYAGATRTVSAAEAVEAAEAGAVSVTVELVTVTRAPSTYASVINAPEDETSGTATGAPRTSAHPAVTTGIATTTSPAPVETVVVPLMRAVNVRLPSAGPVVNETEMAPATSATTHVPDDAPTDQVTDSTDATVAPWTFSVIAVYAVLATRVVVAAPVGDRTVAVRAKAPRTVTAYVRLHSATAWSPTSTVTTP